MVTLKNNLFKFGSFILI